MQDHKAEAHRMGGGNPVSRLLVAAIMGSAMLSILAEIMLNYFLPVSNSRLVTVLVFFGTLVALGTYLYRDMRKCKQEDIDRDADLILERGLEEIGNEDCEALHLAKMYEE